MAWRNPGLLAGTLILVWLVSGCGAPPVGSPTEIPDPRPGTVQEMAPFQQFIDTRPTPEVFGQVYPDVLLVLPGDPATREYRHDHSRFFAELDDQGRIQGGRFQ